MKYLELINEVNQNPNSKSLRESVDKIIADFLDKVASAHPDKYEWVIGEMWTCVMGPHFDEDTAFKAVDGMKNVDGTTGQHWDIDQTTQAASQAGIQFNTFNIYDWYYVLNMMWSDYSDVFGNDSNTYIKLAKSWLDDPDVPEGKAWRYYKDVVKA